MIHSMSTRLAIPTTIGFPDRFRPAGAAAALIGSALVHATVVSDHYRGWVLAGLFFLALQVSETLLGLAVLLAWSRRVAAAVVACNLATLGVWAMSRTIGVPLGPPGFSAPEPVGTADLACVVLELAALALVLTCALGRSPRPARTAGAPTARAGAATAGAGAATAGAGAAVVGVATVMALLVVTGWGLGPALSGDQHDHHHSAIAP
jgi:hypothetical protein